MFGIYIPATSGFFIHLQGLLYSFKYLLNEDYIIKIVDNGLTKKQIDWCKKNFNYLNLEILPLRNYTAKQKQAYKFKIDVIDLMIKDNYEFAMNMDCKNHLKMDLKKIKEEVKKTKILVNISGQNTEKSLTHEKSLQTMGIFEDNEIRNSYQYQAGNIVYHLPQALDIMKEIVKYGNDEMALCPPGSDLSNHRQDQSVCSVILKKNNIEPSYLNYASVHNTINVIN